MKGTVEPFGAESGRRERVPVQYDATMNVLTVGDRSVALAPAADGAGNEHVLRTYLDLVAAVRGVTVGRDMQLRDDDIEALGTLLHVDDRELHARLIRMLGVDARTARQLRSRIRRHRNVLVAASLSLGAFAASPLMPHVNKAPVAPVAAPSTQRPAEIGSALIIERGMQPADPNVQIGDAVTYER